MAVVIDANVLVAANGRDCPQASEICRQACRQQLLSIQQNGELVLDDKRQIIKEYYGRTAIQQKGIGDLFLKWVLINQMNPDCCELVPITPNEKREFEEFPDDADLAKFDRSDRKFVAVARSHPKNPPILNTVDSDWQEFELPLNRYVQIKFLCPDYLASRL